MTPYTYLIIDIGCILVPFIASFYPKHPFKNQWKPFFYANSLVAVFFLIWDAYFTKILVWGFNDTYLTGIKISNLPLAEVLFFVCIPYACVFTFFALKYLVKNNPLKSIHYWLTLVLILLSLGISIFNFNKWYTGSTFIFLAIYLGVHFVKKTNLSYHYLAYFLILPFFFISNGILTGSFLDAPIVWYNDAENLGIRIFTIPVEDAFYGMLLIFMNIDLYQYFKHQQA